MTTGPTLADVRQRLLTARRTGDRDLLGELIEDVETLGRRGYRCCLVDFESGRPDYYVRLLGFDDARVRAELEFPIDPGVQAQQRLPLSHLVDYDDADPERIREIYRQLAPFLHQRRAALAARPVERRRPETSTTHRGVHRRHAAPSMTVWWAIAGLLFLLSLAVFVVA
jgi:hypothetical protein